MNDFPFKGQPRHWFITPFLFGLCLMLLAVLILIWPMILRLMVAVPLFLGGLALTLVGLDLWRGAARWRGRVRGIFSSMGSARPPED